MNEDKLFLTYNQQMKKLRNDKHIECNGSNHKKILVRAGYFNIVNGYKTPLVVKMLLAIIFIYLEQQLANFKR